MWEAFGSDDFSIFAINRDLTHEYARNGIIQNSNLEIILSKQIDIDIDQLDAIL